MGDFGKPPSYKGSNNCRPYIGAQSENSESESICHKPFSSPLNVCQLVCFLKKLNMCNPNIIVLMYLMDCMSLRVTHLGWQFKAKVITTKI
jgi:hypothetical protein